MTDNDRPLNLEPATLAALGLGAEQAKPGNVAAHLWRLAYATPSDPFQGINLGWKDQQESTDYLVNIVHLVDELEDLDDDQLHELADSAVPSCNATEVASQLPFCEVDDFGLLGGPSVSVNEFAAVALYETATQLVAALMRAIRDVQDNDETDDDDYCDDHTPELGDE